MHSDIQTVHMLVLFEYSLCTQQKFQKMEEIVSNKQLILKCLPKDGYRPNYMYLDATFTSVMNF